MTNIPHTHETLKPDLKFLDEVSKDIEQPTDRQTLRSFDGMSVDERWFFSLREILDSPQEPKFWGPLVKGSNNALVASSEAGKTTLIRNLIAAIILGEPTFLGWQLHAPRKRVIIISSEDGKGSAADFFRSYFNGQPTELLENVIVVLDGYKIEQRIEYLLNEFPSDAVIIDTWGDAIGGEYQADTTRKKIQTIRNICRNNDATPIYVHHTNKASENIPHKSSVKGAGDFEQAMRCVLMLTIFRETRWLCIAKSNDATDHEKDIARELTYSHATKRIDLSGRMMSRKEIINSLRKELYGGNSKSIEWSDLVNEPMTYSELRQAYMNASGQSDRTAERKIKTAIESGDLILNDNKYELPTHRQTTDN